MHCTLYRSKYDLTQLKLHLLLCSQLDEESKVEGKKEIEIEKEGVEQFLGSLLHKSVARSSGGQVVLIIS